MSYNWLDVGVVEEGSWEDVLLRSLAIPVVRIEQIDLDLAELRMYERLVIPETAADLLFHSTWQGTLPTSFLTHAESIVTTYLLRLIRLIAVCIEHFQ